jgi:DNA polymerase III subunit delta'
MGFSDIIGHGRQIEVIRRSIANGHLPPAYLFYGDEGIGKRLVALELAKTLNCTSPGPDGDACGECRDCRNIESGCHPNVSVLAVEANEKTGRLRQEIVIDQVRSAQEFLSLRAVGEGAKLLIVDGAHLLNEEAANALLKTLEEPPDGSHAVLVTSRPGSLLQTIHSRCRSIGFAPLGEPDVAAALVSMRGMQEGDARLIAKMTGGRLGLALGTDADELRQRRGSFIGLLGQLAEGGDARLLKRAEEASKTDGALEDLVFFGTLWFRDVVVILLGGGAELTYNDDMLDELEAWADRLSLSRCEDAIGLLSALGRSLERTFNRRLLAEETFLRVREEVLA